MKYLKHFEELKGKYKEETEILFRNKDLICLIPKSQMTSHIYGRGTYWCSTHKGAFDPLSMNSLLIRFLFKNGQKMRLTYTIKRENHEFDWATEDGVHILRGSGESIINPFYFVTKKHEKEGSERIKRIPEECRNIIMNKIETFSKKGPNRIIRGEEYKSPRESKSMEQYEDLKGEFAEDLWQLKGHKIRISFNYVKTSRRFVLVYDFDYDESKDKWKEETFTDVNKLRKRVEELISLGKEKIKSR